ncbi:hypothetical protein HZS_2763 [Henneguya salminicola]|nr:hypothetical protein HZS_2763 [Henneguya salminicola]
MKKLQIILKPHGIFYPHVWRLILILLKKLLKYLSQIIFLN